MAGRAMVHSLRGCKLKCCGDRAGNGMRPGRWGARELQAGRRRPRVSRRAALPTQWKRSQKCRCVYTEAPRFQTLVICIKALLWPEQSPGVGLPWVTSALTRVTGSWRPMCPDLALRAPRSPLGWGRSQDKRWPGRTKVQRRLVGEGLNTQVLSQSCTTVPGLMLPELPRGSGLQATPSLPCQHRAARATCALL